MRLTKDSKYVLDVLIANPPGMNSNTYNVIAWMSVIDEKKIHSYSDYTGVLAYLAECKCIEWVNDSHSDFRLTENGRNYKELRHKEWRSAISHEIIGFLLGVCSTLLVKFLTNLIWGKVGASTFQPASNQNEWQVALRHCAVLAQNAVGIKAGIFDFALQILAFLKHFF